MALSNQSIGPTKRYQLAGPIDRTVPLLFFKLTSHFYVLGHIGTHQRQFKRLLKYWGPWVCTPVSFPGNNRTVRMEWSKAKFKSQNSGTIHGITSTSECDCQWLLYPFLCATWASARAHHSLSLPCPFLTHFHFTHIQQTPITKKPAFLPVTSSSDSKTYTSVNPHHTYPKWPPIFGHLHIGIVNFWKTRSISFVDTKEHILRETYQYFLRHHSENDESHFLCPNLSSAIMLTPTFSPCI